MKMKIFIVIMAIVIVVAAFAEMQALLLLSVLLLVIVLSIQGIISVFSRTKSGKEHFIENHTKNKPKRNQNH